MNEKNNITVTGTVDSELKFSHNFINEKFYETTIKVERISGKIDFVRIRISEKIIVTDFYGKKVRVCGELRSDNNVRNKELYGRNHINFIFVESIDLIDPDDSQYDENIILLDGYICKSEFRTTLSTKRNICDVIIATNRKYNKSDYTPCLFWGRDAFFTSKLPVGTRIKIRGRIQSRFFVKNGREIKIEEVSVQEIISYEKLEEKEGKKYEENETENAKIG